jgi:hypothetical protein
MSLEHLMLIDPHAISAVRMECSKCHAALSFRLVDGGGPPLHCFACREQFSGSDAFGAVQALVDAFGLWTKTQTTHAPRFSLRLEMSPMMMHAGPRQTTTP